MCDDYSIRSPIVLFIFLRDSNVLQTINVLRQVNARSIYLVGEGPRPDRKGERERVLNVRDAVLKAIDWDCSVKTNFVDEDIGAGNRIASGISWVFEYEERAIFLEDDVAPTIDFFRYCDELLEYYNDDKRIMAVCGSNLIQEYGIEESYLFSQLVFPWGWATWKRAWLNYDYKVSEWKRFKKSRYLEKQFPDKTIYRIRAKTWDQAYSGIDYTWDYQFLFHIMINSGYTIIPKKNLICYLGFDDVSTNSTGRNKFMNTPCELDLPLVHPQNVFKNIEYEKQYYDTWEYNHHPLRKKIKYYLLQLFQ